ncbi:MAG: hypothetical protein LDL53_04120 [Candidatus Hydrogenedens sp.]|nr:hypothetical protein [Candidatus Hydrogenedens sp.]
MNYPSIIKKTIKWTLYSISIIIVLILIGFLYLFRTAIHHRFIDFPREKKAWEELRKQYQQPVYDDGWNDYAGVCHSHSELSHDSMVPFPEILSALKQEHRQFICLSDHCDNGKADYSKQWRGEHDGVIFIPGFEMNYGFMPWGLPPDTVLDCKKDPESLAKEINEKGGLLFFAHSEEPREWNLPQLNGMEIYNIHTNFKSLDKKFLIYQLVPDIILNLNKYHEQLLRSIFSPLTEVIQRWDEMNITRKIVGISANDCHQNTGFVGKITPQGTLYIEDTSPHKIGEYKLNFFSRLLLRMLFGKLEPGKTLFHIQLDPYPTMVRYVATHILAKELSEQSVLEALKEGRVFVGFDMLVDTKGFVFFAEDNNMKAVFGETLPLTSNTTLKMASPVPCKFIIYRHGVPVQEHEGRDFSWQPTEKGKYRVEAQLKINDKWVPWVYTNPVELN